MIDYILILGNTLSLIVWTRPSLRRGSSSSLLLACLAVADTLVLLNQPLIDWLHKGPYGHSLRDHSNVLCKISAYLLFVTSGLSAYTLVVLGVFRAIGISQPHKYKSLCTRKNTAITMTCVYTIVLLMYLHRLFQYKLLDWRGVGIWRCNIVIKNQLWDLKVVPNIESTLMAYMPLTLIFMINFFIVFKLIERKIRTLHGTSATTDSDAGPGTSKIVYTLIAVSVVFIITQTPLAVFLAWRQTVDWPKAGPKLLALTQLYWSVASNLAIMNNACNFLLYCLTGSRFRQELALVLCRPRSKITVHQQRGHQSSPVQAIISNTQSSIVLSQIGEQENTQNIAGCQG